MTSENPIRFAGMNCREPRRIACGFLIVMAATLQLSAGRDVIGALFAPPHAVGHIATNRWALPNGQLISPAGTQVSLPGMRPQVLAFSPDHKLLVTAGKSNGITVIDVASARVVQHVSYSTNRNEVKPPPKPETEDKDQLQVEDPAAKPEGTNGFSRGNSTNSSGTQLSFTGLAFAPNGKRIYVSTASATIRAFPVENQMVGTPTIIPVPEVRGGRSRREIPTGIAVSDDSQRIYVAGNVAGKLHEIDVETGKALRSWDTGVAPFDVVLTGGKAYVSNVGGRRPGTNDLSASAGRGTKVRVDGIRFIPNEGSVTVIDLISGTVKTEITVGLHSSAMALSPDRKYLVVANTGSDTLSVIDTRTDRVVEKIWTRQTPADLFGAQPNALTFDRRGKRLYVCNGTQNAVAVVQFEPEDNASKVVGLIPVGWFPGAIEFDAAHNQLCVANIKGVGVDKSFKPSDRVKLATKDYWGTVSLVRVPSDKDLAIMTRIAQENMRYPMLAEAKLPPRPDQPARPVPERVGEPSVFKHVIYVIKENRSYDQVLGDMLEGNGNTNLCTFGERYTPNQHKIAREFILLDKTYCSGVQSADGHKWTDSAIANEYVERQLTAGWPRSYPGAKVEDGIDALAWSSSGFIWDNALAHGKSFRNYGEWMISEAGWTSKSAHGRTNVSWRDFWGDYAQGTTETRLKCKPGIESLRKHSKLDTVGWDLHVPDVRLAAEFIKELRQFEVTGDLPEFILLFLPNDHTGGTKGRYPIPGAQVADNDLAFGQVVEAVSHSKFWADTCIFAIEDDPQMGWDHVSGYRTTCYVASSYTKRRQTISTQYNQVSVVRTMELILGLPPMNQMDATATPMTECFSEVQNLAGFNSVTNRVPLDQINPEPKKIANRILRQDAYASAKFNLDEPDRCPEDLLNQILWRAMKGPDVPFPQWAVKAGADND